MRGQRGRPVREHQMQADRERRQPPRAFDRIPAAGAPTIRLAAFSTPSRCARSTAALTRGCSPKSSAVKISARAAGCVATNQASCARRKRKNSTPSRRRRFIMSQLVSISRTISQIFDGRK